MEIFLNKSRSQLIFIVILLLLATIAFGCASIVKSGPQMIPINCNPTDADIKIIDDRKKNEIANGKTPYNASLNRGAGYFKSARYRVVIAKEGYENGEMLINGELNGWYVGGNLIFGGLIGYLLVDPATGAMWTLKPDEVNLELTKKDTPEQVEIKSGSSPKKSIVNKDKVIIDEDEISLWRSVRNSNDIDMHKKYLNEFPEGKFVELAKINIENLSITLPAKPQLKKLAVFPWHVNTRNADQYMYDEEKAEESAVDALKQALSSSDIIELTHSFYKLGKEFKTKLINRSIIPGGDINELWRKKRFLSRSSPNIDLVCELGKQLKVDIVLLYSIVVRHRYSTKIYFVDVNKKEVFTRSDVFYSLTYTGDIKKFTQKSFTAYENQILN